MGTAGVFAEQKGDGKKLKFDADALQWMHFAAVQRGLALDQVEQTRDKKRGVLGKRLYDALTDLFFSDAQTALEQLELLVFDAEDEQAWINPERYYFVPAKKVTTQLRFFSASVWRALVAAVVMANQEQAQDWMSLRPGKTNLDRIRASAAYQSNTIETLYHLLELLVRGMPYMEETASENELAQLITACQNQEQRAAARVESIAWHQGNANLWRYAMAVADGKFRLARLFEDRLK